MQRPSVAPPISRAASSSGSAAIASARIRRLLARTSCVALPKRLSGSAGSPTLRRTAPRILRSRASTSQLRVEDGADPRAQVVGAGERLAREAHVLVLLRLVVRQDDRLLGGSNSRPRRATFPRPARRRASSSGRSRAGGRGPARRRRRCCVCRRSTKRAARPVAHGAQDAAGAGLARIGGDGSAAIVRRRELTAPKNSSAKGRQRRRAQASRAASRHASSAQRQTRNAAGPIHTSPSSLATTSSSPSHGMAPKRDLASAAAARHEAQRHERALALHPVATARAQRARAVVEHREDYPSTRHKIFLGTRGALTRQRTKPLCICGTTGGGSCARRARRRIR